MRKNILFLLCFVIIMYVFAYQNRVLVVQIYLDKTDCHICNEMKMNVVRQIAKHFGEDKVKCVAVIRKNQDIRRLKRWFENYGVKIPINFCNDEKWNKIMFREGKIDLKVLWNDGSGKERTWSNVVDDPHDALKGINEWINNQLSR